MRRALAELAFHIDLAAMQGDQALDDRQSEPGAVVAAVIGRARLEERIAEPRQVAFADADAGILDRDGDARAVVRAHRHAAAADR